MRRPWTSSKKRPMRRPMRPPGTEINFINLALEPPRKGTVDHGLPAGGGRARRRGTPSSRCPLG
jgi:hypothetical protein